MKVKVELLEGATMPSFAHLGDLGMDLYPSHDVVIPGAALGVKVPTGLKFELPQGFGLDIRPKSGNSIKTPIRVILGTVDNGYRGEVNIIVDNFYNADYVWKKSNALAQGVLVQVNQLKIEQVDEVNVNTTRAEGGFGSTKRGFYES